MQTKSRIARKLAVPTDVAWHALAAFGRLDVWFPSISSCRVEGAGVGARRFMLLVDGIGAGVAGLDADLSS